MKNKIKEGIEQNPIDEEWNPSNISEEVTYGNLSCSSAARGLPSPYLYLCLIFMILHEGEVLQLLKNVMSTGILHSVVSQDSFHEVDVVPNILA
jgi:hypothetical protein